MKALARRGNRRRASATYKAVLETLDTRVMMDANGIPPTAFQDNSVSFIAPGKAAVTVTVQYNGSGAASNGLISRASLGTGDVVFRLTDSSGDTPTTTDLTQATLVSADQSQDAATITATYSLPVPTTIPTATGQTLSIVVPAGAVVDSAGTPIAEDILDSSISPASLGTGELITFPGQPIEAVFVGRSNGSIQIINRRFNGGQFFGPSSFGSTNAGVTIRTIDPTSPDPANPIRRAYGQRGTTPTLVSQTVSEDRRSITNVYSGGADNNTPFTLTEVFSYTPGDEFITVTVTVQNTGTQAFQYDQFIAADLYLADSDSGTGFFNEQTNAVGGTSRDGQFNIFFQGVPGQLQPTHYESGGYSPITSLPGTTASTGTLDYANTVDPTLRDNGAGLEWKGNTVQPGQSLTIPFFAAFGNVSAVSSGPAASIPGGLAAQTTAANFTFPVTYTDATTVNASTIDNNDIVVTGPNGYSATAQLVSTGLTSGSTVVASYRVPQPQGGFVNDATYTVTFNNGATADVQGNLSAGGPIGTFTASPTGSNGSGGGDPIVRGPSLKIGGLDTGFGGGDGVATITLQNQNARTVGITAQGDKLIVAVSTTPAAGGASDFMVFRLNADGSLDTTFGTAGFASANFPVSAVANNVRVLADGRILMVGTAGSTADGSADLAAARFTADGQLDASFGTGGRVVQDLTSIRGLSTPSNDVARAVLINADNSFFVGGLSDARAGAAGDFLVARFNAAGALDGAFGSTGAVFVPFDGDAAVNALVAGARGQVIAVGSDVANGQSQIAAVRVNANGTLDNKFGTNGRFKTAATGAHAQGFAAAVQPDGKVLLAGNVSTGTLETPSSSSFALVRIDNRGRPDRSFSRDGVVTTSFADVGQNFAGITDLSVTGTRKDIRILASGKSASTFDMATSRSRGIALARYDAKGNLDASFGTAGKAVLLTPDTFPGFSAANDGLASAFDAFTADAQGAIARTQGGGIRALASDNNTQNTSVFVAAIVADGVDLSSTLTQRNPQSVIGGAKGNATVSVRNNGSQIARGRVPVTIYASTDQTLSSDDRAIATQQVAVNLAPGKSKAQRLNFTFPTDLNGQFFLIAEVNSGATPVFGEINLNNNDAPSPATIQVAPANVDLSGIFVNPPGTLTAGRQTITVNVTNASSANSTARGRVTLNLFRSDDQTAGNNDDQSLGTATGNINLRPGQTRAVRFTLTLPTLPPGTDFLLGTLTYNGTPADGNPANNSFFSPAEITFA